MASTSIFFAIFLNTFPFFIHRAVGSSSVAFWALFGLIELSEFEMEKHYVIVKDIAMVLFGVFNVLAVLVTLNMLIAILNESFSQESVSVNMHILSKVSISMCFHD